MKKTVLNTTVDLILYIHTNSSYSTLLNWLLQKNSAGDFLLVQWVNTSPLNAEGVGFPPLVGS